MLGSVTHIIHFLVDSINILLILYVPVIMLGDTEDKEKEYTVFALEMLIAKWEYQILINGKFHCGVLGAITAVWPKNYGKILETVIFNEEGKLQLKCTYQHRFPLADKSQ